MKKLDQYEVRIEDWTNQSQGVARVDDLVVFVERALPGDLALIEITEVKKSFARARTIEIIEPSKDRRVSPCLYSAICDGCSLIEYSYEKQIEWKRDFIENAFQRIGFADVKTCMNSFENLAYRNKVNMRLDDLGRLSFSKQKTNAVFHVDTCVVAQESIQEIIGKWNTYLPQQDGWIEMSQNIRMVLIRSNSKDEIMIVLVLDPIGEEDRNKIFAHIKLLEADVLCACENKRKGDVEIHKPLYFATEKETLEEKIFDLDFTISPQSFFQVNRFAIEALYKEAISLFTDLSKGTVLDLYCGTGTTSLLLAKEAKKVIGVEMIGAAVKDAKKNAKRNRIDNVEFIKAKAEEVVANLTKSHKITKAIVDPPRKGLDKKVVQAITDSAIQELVYISCNPTTQARDVKDFKEAGFTIQEVKGIDQFPNTSHVETIALIQKI